MSQQWRLVSSKNTTHDDEFVLVFGLVDNASPMEAGVPLSASAITIRVAGAHDMMSFRDAANLIEASGQHPSHFNADTLTPDQQWVHSDTQTPFTYNEADYVLHMILNDPDRKSFDGWRYTAEELPDNNTRRFVIRAMYLTTGTFFDISSEGQDWQFQKAQIEQARLATIIAENE